MKKKITKCLHDQCSRLRLCNNIKKTHRVHIFAIKQKPQKTCLKYLLRICAPVRCTFWHYGVCLSIFFGFFLFLLMYLINTTTMFFFSLPTLLCMCVCIVLMQCGFSFCTKKNIFLGNNFINFCTKEISF